MLAHQPYQAVVHVNASGRSTYSAHHDHFFTRSHEGCIRIGNDRLRGRMCKLRIGVGKLMCNSESRDFSPRSGPGASVRAGSLRRVLKHLPDGRRNGDIELFGMFDQVRCLRFRTETFTDRCGLADSSPQFVDVPSRNRYL